MALRMLHLVRMIGGCSVTTSTAARCQWKPTFTYWYSMKAEQTEVMENHLTQANSPFGQKVQTANSVENILSFVEVCALTPSQSVYVLFVLNRWLINRKTITHDFKDDPRFLKVCQVVEENCQKLSHTSLISCLRSLLELGFSSDLFIMKSLENEILWRARKMSFKLLSLCLSFHVHHQETDLQKKVVNELIQVLQRRYFEIADATDVIKVLENGSNFSENFLVKVEDRALDNVNSMTVNELCKLLLCLAGLNRRPVPLLRAVSFHISQHASKLTLKQSLTVLHSLNILSYPDSVLLQRISTDVLPEIENIDRGPVVSSLLTPLGQMKWRYPALMESLGNWILKQKESCRSQEFVAYLLTLASVNYLPEDPEPVFEVLHRHLVRENISSDVVWLDVVWSLAILGKAYLDHVASVLDPAFYGPLISISGFPGLSRKAKLMNLNAVAKLELPSCRTLSYEPALEDVTVSKLSSASGILSKSVIDVINNFIPKGKFMATNLNTDIGVFIDAEFIVDKAIKPLPLAEYGVSAGLSKDLKSLPPGFHRVALLVWDFKDFTLHDQTLIGVNAMAVRLLTKLGYAVLEVHYTEYNVKDTTVKRVQYLQQKIKDVIKQCSNSGQRKK